MPKVYPFKTPDGKPISNAIEEWNNLSDRDFVVVGCSVIDAGLTHLLQKRFADLPEIAENFLGVGEKMEGGGASTLSSKAELAALVGLITANDVKYLKAFMRIRNHFAHRVVMDFMTDCVVEQLNKLKPLVEQTTSKDWKNDPHPGVQELHRMIIEDGIRKIGKTNSAGRTVFSWARVIFESRFWLISSNNERVKTLQTINFQNQWFDI
jgi:hypothetical protein